MSSSRPVNETGWKATNEIFFGFSMANLTMAPTWSLLTLLTMVTTRMISMPALHILDGAQLDVEQVADLAVAIGVVADAVELQVSVSQARLEGLPAELLALGELNAVGGRLDAVEF